MVWRQRVQSIQLPLNRKAEELVLKSLIDVCRPLFRAGSCFWSSVFRSVRRQTKTLSHLALNLSSMASCDIDTLSSFLLLCSFRPDEGEIKLVSSLKKAKTDELKATSNVAVDSLLRLLTLSGWKRRCQAYSFFGNNKDAAPVGKLVWLIGQLLLLTTLVFISLMQGQ